jgi:Cft2 family RNA processing exonuclease
MDHSGALPVLHQHFPFVPVYSTASTRGLVEVLHRDSLNIMRHKAESERELPLYSQGAVESLLESMIPVPFGAPTPLGNSKLTATWFPAGHILGAASVGIEGVENGRTVRVLFSGDISVGDQLTVAGMLAPKDFRPDVLVIEATYGDRLHAARALEERRLFEMVAGIVERKGKLLIPAFAVGRAQEILLMLLREFRAKRLKSFPVYVDGMVRSVCGVYSSFPSHQTPFTRRLIEKHNNPFFNIVDEIRQVATPQEREKVLSGEPCCIIASSGMLTGGASAFYAPFIAADKLSGIAVTGYQDEESPGRQLLDLADGQVGQLNVGGRAVEVKCSVAKYALSAHADADEITGLIESINPRNVVLVHGEGQARPALADKIRRSGGRFRPVHLPRTGDTLSFGATRKITTRIIEHEQIGFGGGAELSAPALSLLAQGLRRNGEDKNLYSEIDLLNLWYGPNVWTEENYNAIVKLLDDNETWRRHPARPHLYRIRRQEDEDKTEETMFFAEPNEMLTRIENALGPESGLYRKGYDLAQHELRLSFHFPNIARQRYTEKIQSALEGTGWTYAINEQPHQGRLVEVALDCLPAGIAPLRPPAIRPEDGAVTIALDQQLSDDDYQQTIARFYERTGCALRIKMPLPHSATNASITTTANKATTLFLSSFEPSEVFTADPGDAASVEINQAYWIIEEAFGDAPETWRPYKKGIKREGEFSYIELAFISPQIGLRQKERIEQTARLIGHHLRVKNEPNQIKLTEIAARTALPEWKLQKQPSVHKGEGAVRLKCLNAPSPDDSQWLAIRQQFEEMTGYSLELQ